MDNIRVHITAGLHNPHLSIRETLTLAKAANKLLVLTFEPTQITINVWPDSNPSDLNKIFDLEFELHNLKSKK